MGVRMLARVGSGLLLLVAWVLSGAAVADEPSRAGLVVQFGDGHIETRCISFQEEEISGAELLLTQSGLDIIADASSGMGITVCQIEAVGCPYPGKPCFCQCMGGGECAYWNYFYLEPGSSEWTYSALGAVLRKVRNGSIEAWVWGDGSTPPAFDGTFESICAEPTAEPTATTEPPTATPAAITILPASTQPPEPTATPLPTITPTAPEPVQTPAPSAGQTLLSYWPFGLMVLGLGLIGLLVRLRTGR